MINFREVELGDAKKILDWRTSERVTNFMNSDIKYDLAGQEYWLSSNFNRPDYYHWIIQHAGEDVGLLNFIDWDAEAKTTSWGFYIGEESALGVGGLVPPYFYNFAFGVLGVDVVNAEVFYDNTSVINLHLKQGSHFDPDRDHVIQKNDKEILMICMRLKKEQFMTSKFARLRKELPIEKWAANPL